TEVGHPPWEGENVAPEPNRQSAYNGAAAVTLSMRSNRPPCPGSKVPLSLSAAARLNMLSVRSPMMEKIPTQHPNATTAAGDSPKYTAPQPATRATMASPPSAPSQLLPERPRGANLRCPKARPAKYAPMSAAHTMSTSHNTIGGPCAAANPGPEICSLASATNAGASTANPQKSVSTGRWRAGAKDSQRKAITHQAHATLNSPSRWLGSSVQRQLASSTIATAAVYAPRAKTPCRERNACNPPAPSVKTAP